MATRGKFDPTDPAIVPRFADVATFLRACRHDIDPKITARR